LLGGAVFMVVQAEAVFGYARATADALHEPQRYVDAVMRARTVPSPTGGMP
jgi:multicomponent K+:H+ antiporter subunit D